MELRGVKVRRLFTVTMSAVDLREALYDEMAGLLNAA